MTKAESQSNVAEKRFTSRATGSGQGWAGYYGRYFMGPRGHANWPHDQLMSVDPMQASREARA